MPCAVTVVIPTYNPDPSRFGQTLQGLARQKLPRPQWEILIVDNASNAEIGTPAGDLPCRIVREQKPGLTSARKAGLRHAAGEIVVFVDDDNVLAPDYLEQTLAAFARLPRVGALGGKSLPSFETEPPAWASEFVSLLALRDLGDSELVSNGLRSANATTNVYPKFAPQGAGMAVRREAIQPWFESSSRLTDRCGADLTSSGDNDIVFSIMEAGWEVAYLPQLVLTHLIPAARLTPDYLARLNRGIQKSWIQVLRTHNACPWPPVPPWTIPMRKAKAWFVHRAWTSPAARIRWQGACGHFEGRART